MYIYIYIYIYRSDLWMATSCWNRESCTSMRAPTSYTYTQMAEACEHDSRVVCLLRR